MGENTRLLYPHVRGQGDQITVLRSPQFGPSCNSKTWPLIGCTHAYTHHITSNVNSMNHFVSKRVPIIISYRKYIMWGVLDIGVPMPACVYGDQTFSVELAAVRGLRAIAGVDCLPPYECAIDEINM